MKKYYSPGVGDWSIYPSGAVYMDGAEHVVLDNCTFTQLGGNAVFMFGYNRFHNISWSEFNHLGDSAVALVGRSHLADATGGDFPSDVTVAHNHIHEIGIITKQASPFFQTVSCGNTISSNVLYNGPRAGINFNDGMGGGDLVSKNVIFNMVRCDCNDSPLSICPQLQGLLPKARTATLTTETLS